MSDGITSSHEGVKITRYDQAPNKGEAMKPEPAAPRVRSLQVQPWWINAEIVRKTSRLMLQGNPVDGAALGIRCYRDLLLAVLRARRAEYRRRKP